VPAAAVRTLDNPVYDEPVRPHSAPPSESMRPEPRFRVVTRKPLPAQRRRVGSPVQRVALVAAVPAVFLVVYILFWTMAVRGGYYKNQLEDRIAKLKIEQSELEAEKRRQQAPVVILPRAEKQLGMRPAEERRFAQLPKAAAPAQKVVR
jgi:hypothetical protein